MKLICLPLLFIFAGCATATKYQPYDKNTGYVDNKVDDHLLVARFEGNSFTDKNEALAFSQLRAIEVCKAKGYSIARILSSEDKTVTREVQNTSIYSLKNPTYISGSGTTFATGYTSYSDGDLAANSNSPGWTQTFVYPAFETFFSCTNTASLIQVNLKDLKAEDIKDLVKDQAGASQVVDFAEDSPNKGVLKIGDVIVSVDGQRATTNAQVVADIDASKNKENIVLEIFRNGQELKVHAKAIDGTPLYRKMMDQLLTSTCIVPEVKDRPICNLRAPASSPNSDLDPK